MNLINLREVPLDSLKQIYFKNNNVRKFQHIKPGHNMRVNQTATKELRKTLSLTGKALLAYCLLELKYNPDSIIDTMSMVIDYEKAKGDVTTNRKNFFAAAKDLEDAGFLLKYKPKTYLVNPHYISMLSSDQIRYLNDKRYQILGGEIDHNILKELE